MARSEGRISVDIWTDPDFTTRTTGAQQRFMFLISQPDLAHDGVIPLRPNRWASKTAGATIATVRAELIELEDSNLVVVDDDTEEVLVRSLIRRDKVFRQPNVMRAAVDHVPLIESASILEALTIEIERIVGENPDLSEQQLAALDEMRNELARRVKVISPKPLTEAYENPSAKGTADLPGERGDVTVGEYPSPRSPFLDSPDPRPPDPPPLASLASGSVGARSRTAKTGETKATRIPDDFKADADMVAWARVKAPDVNGRRETEAFVNYWLSRAGAGATKRNWELTWRNWMLKAQTDAERNGSRASPRAKTSTTDERVGAALALAAEFRTEANGQLGLAS